MKADAVYYEGSRARGGEACVTKHVGDDATLLPARTDLGRFSGGEFDWGTHGPRSAQLALALCADVLGDEHGLVVCHRFKTAVVVRFPPAGFRITAEAVEVWARRLDETRQVPSMPREGVELFEDWPADDASPDADSESDPFR